MKISSSSNQNGGVLVACLMVVVLLSLVLLATLNLTSTQRKIVSRAQSWNTAIPMCEAALEDAMAHLNYSGTTNLGSDGWSSTSSNYWRSNAMTGGYYYVTLSTSKPPIITAQGYIWDALRSNYVTRTVQVNTKVAGQFPNAILAKGQITMSGAASIDSFNSSNPSYNTAGHYDSTKAEANAQVDTTAGGAGIIKVDTAKIYGSVDTGPTGTISIGGGAVGTSAWDASNSGVQSGHSAADVNTIIPDVVLPSLTGALTPTNGSFSVGGTNYNYVLIGGNYSMNTDPNIQGGNAMLVTAPTTLYVNNTFTVGGSGYIYIAPGGSLQLYVNGNVTISGSGIVNGSQTASQCQIWGMTNCTTLTYSGSAVFIGTVYAPEADVTLSGSAASIGAFVGKTFTDSGGSSIHYDEALGGPTGYKYLAASWQEQ